MEKPTIRQAKAKDAPLLPAVERSAAQAFLQFTDLAWLATGDVQSVKQHLEFIRRGLERVAVDAEESHFSMEPSRAKTFTYMKSPLDQLIREEELDAA
ncbi:GCN5- N-acetyltransferase [Penicillium hordei]|jgi:hypothetical protein|uniref:GCN5- N-acetyltransferase n=1 Tax=Penicillium hordei TaxID=40994 RepID=A0AAD6E5N4_9EURO|nr:GCN5- N-acetyltransferase [Penicillium hordei]KAJ5602519.1 GCN5- N-acetyltransferase [Penicillium hordei]